MFWRLIIHIVLLKKKCWRKFFLKTEKKTDFNVNKMRKNILRKFLIPRRKKVWVNLFVWMKRRPQEIQKANTVQRRKGRNKICSPPPPSMAEAFFQWGKITSLNRIVCASPPGGGSAPPKVLVYLGLFGWRPACRRAWLGNEVHGNTAPTKGTYPTPPVGVDGYVAYNQTLCASFSWHCW